MLQSEVALKLGRHAQIRVCSTPGSVPLGQGLCLIFLGAAVAALAQILLRQLWKKRVHAELETGAAGRGASLMRHHRPQAEEPQAEEASNSRAPAPGHESLTEPVQLHHTHFGQILGHLRQIEQQLQTLAALLKAAAPVLDARSSKGSAKASSSQLDSLAASSGVSSPSSSDSTEAAERGAEHADSVFTFISRCSQSGFATYSFDLHPHPLVLSEAAKGGDPNPYHLTGAAHARAILLALTHMLQTDQLRQQLRGRKLRWLNLDTSLIDCLHGKVWPGSSASTQALHKEADHIAQLVQQLGLSIEWQLATEKRFKAATKLAMAYAKCDPMHLPPKQDMTRLLSAAQAKLRCSAAGLQRLQGHVSG